MPAARDPVRLHLLRHGAPLREGRLLGHLDEPSTETGILACAARVEGLAIDRLITSPLLRARAAADRIGQATGRGAEPDDRWRELDFGAWDGALPADIDPAALARFHDDPDVAPPPGGERWSSLLARVGAAMAETRGGSTLVVTHGGAMRGALAWACGLSARQGWSVSLPYGALLSLDIWPEARAGRIVGLAT